MRQRGFLYLPLWAYAAIGAALCLAFAGMQTYRLKAEREAHSAFKAEVKVLGEQAKKAAETKAAQDRRNKEVADATNKKLRAANDALSASLLNARTAGGYLPRASAGSADPDRITLNRAELESALRRLDEGVSGLIAEGDTARLGLDTARDWAKAR